MTDLGPFPELIERQRLDPDQINGVDPARLTIGAEGDAVVTFRDEVARFENVLAVYLIDQDGTIRGPEVVFRAGTASLPTCWSRTSTSG